MMTLEMVVTETRLLIGMVKNRRQLLSGADSLRGPNLRRLIKRAFALVF